MQANFEKRSSSLVDMVDALKVPRKYYSNFDFALVNERIQKDKHRTKYVNFNGSIQDILQRLEAYEDLEEYYYYLQGAFEAADFSSHYQEQERQLCRLIMLPTSQLKGIPAPTQLNGFLKFVYIDQSNNVCGINIQTLTRYSNSHGIINTQYDVMIAIVKNLERNPLRRKATLLGHQSLFVDTPGTEAIPSKALLQELSKEINSEKVTQLISKIFSTGGNFSMPAYEHLISRFENGSLDNRDNKIIAFKKLTDIVSGPLANVTSLTSYFNALLQKSIDDIDFFEELSYQKTLKDIEKLLYKTHINADENSLRKLNLTLFAIRTFPIIDSRKTDELVSFLEKRLANNPLSPTNLNVEKIVFDALETLKKAVDDCQKQLDSIAGIKDIAKAHHIAGVNAFSESTSELLESSRQLARSQPHDLVLSTLTDRTRELIELSNLIEDPTHDSQADIFLYIESFKKLENALRAKILTIETPTFNSLHFRISKLLHLIKADQETPLPQQIDLLNTAYSSMAFPQKSTFEKLQNMSEASFHNESPMLTLKCSHEAAIIDFEFALTTCNLLASEKFQQNNFCQKGIILLEKIKLLVQTEINLSTIDFLHLKTLIQHYKQSYETEDFNPFQNLINLLIKLTKNPKFSDKIDSLFINDFVAAVFEKSIDLFNDLAKEFQLNSIKSADVDDCVQYGLQIADYLKEIHLDAPIKTAQKISFLTYIDKLLNQPENNENTSKIAVLLADTEFVAVDHPLQQTFLKLQEKAMLVRFEKTFLELKHQLRQFNRCIFDHNNEFCKHLHDLIAYVETIARPINTEKLKSLNQLFYYISDKMTYELCDNANNKYNRTIDRFLFQINLTRSHLRLLDLQAAEESEQPLIIHTQETIESIKAYVSDTPNYLHTLDKFILKSLNNLLWHIANTEHPLKRDQLLQIKGFVDYHKKFKLLKECIRNLEETPMNPLYQPAQNVLQKIAAITNHDPIKLSLPQIQQLNQVMDGVMCGINTPSDQKNIELLTSLSLTSKKSSRLWQGLGTALLVFTGIACIVAGVLGAIPTGGISLLAGISIGLYSLIASQAIASGVKMIQHGSQTNLNSSLSMFTSVLKHTNTNEIKPLNESSVSPAFSTTTSLIPL